MKVFGIVSGIFLSLFIVIKIISPQSPQNSQNILTIGMMSGWAPFMSINAAGDFEGFDVDVARELAQRLGMQLKIVDMGSLATLFIALDNNSIDAIFSGLDITQKRRETLSMIPYAGEDVKEYQLLFWESIPEGITSLSDLKSYSSSTIVVEPGVSGEKYLDQFGFITKKQIATLSDRLLDVQYGKSLAAFLEPTMAKRVISKNPQFKALSIPLPQEFQIYGMGIALKKENVDLSTKIAQKIVQMKEDGTLKRIESTWQL